MVPVPRVAAIHDLSGVGRCSLTVVIPVLSAMGIQVCPFPTAVLSTQTDGFVNYTFCDLTDSMPSYASHWKSIGLSFDCIYTGFLGSARQIDIVSGFVDVFRRKEGQIVVVDPVMGDEGRLYDTYTDDMRHGMRSLVARADVATPNLTEACFLLDFPYMKRPLSLEEIEQILKGVSAIGPDKVVVTSVQMTGGSYANVAYERAKNRVHVTEYERLAVHYPGTGDTFTSVLTGRLIHGDDLQAAVAWATRFVFHAVRLTQSLGTPEREGIALEQVLGALVPRKQIRKPFSR